MSDRGIEVRLDWDAGEGALGSTEAVRDQPYATDRGGAQLHLRLPLVDSRARPLSQVVLERPLAELAQAVLGCAVLGRAQPRGATRLSTSP